MLHSAKTEADFGEYLIYAFETKGLCLRYMRCHSPALSIFYRDVRLSISPVSRLTVFVTMGLLICILKTHTIDIQRGVIMGIKVDFFHTFTRIDHFLMIQYV